MARKVDDKFRFLTKSYAKEGIWIKMDELSKKEQADLLAEIFITNECDREFVVKKHLKAAIDRRRPQSTPE